MAKAYLGAGYQLTIAGRDESRLRAAADAIGAGSVRTIAADLSVAGEAQRVIEESVTEAGRLDAVCHAAGRSSRGWIRQTSREDFEQLLAINFLAAAELAAASADALIESRGSLVLIGSLATFLAPAGLGAYPASKHPLAALAQQYRIELGPSGHHTLLVCPGPIARDDAGQRYDESTEGLPDELRKPGGGAKVRSLDPDWLAQQVLTACRQRKAELVVPRKVRLLLAISRLFPEWGDRLLSRQTGGQPSD